MSETNAWRPPVPTAPVPAAPAPTGPVPAGTAAPAMSEGGMVSDVIAALASLDPVMGGCDR